MKILYDGQIFTLQPVGGANRYFTNVISGLPPQYKPALTTCSVREANFPSNPFLKIYSFPRFGFWPGRLSYWCEKMYFKSVIKLYAPQIIHQTYYTTLIQEPYENSSHRRLVLTVYDMLQEIFPNDIDPKGTDRIAKKMALERADLIICISQNTKKDLCEYYRVPDNKIKVIPLAANVFPSSNEKVPIQSRYFLFVGTRWSYKNFYRFAKAFSNLAESEKDLSLCLVGPALTDTEKRFLTKLNILERVHSLGYASDSMLASLYKQSIALVYPSLYEGFGIPLLEAMQIGTPVIASQNSSIPEVTGEAALLFNPRSEDSMFDAMKEVLNNPSLRENLIAKGYEQASLFSWGKTVQQTIEAYESLNS